MGNGLHGSKGVGFVQGRMAGGEGGGSKCSRLAAFGGDFFAQLSPFAPFKGGKGAAQQGQEFDKGFCA